MLSERYGEAAAEARTSGKALREKEALLDAVTAQVRLLLEFSIFLLRFSFLFFFVLRQRDVTCPPSRRCRTAVRLYDVQHLFSFFVQLRLFFVFWFSFFLLWKLCTDIAVGGGGGEGGCGGDGNIFSASIFLVRPC